MMKKKEQAKARVHSAFALIMQEEETGFAQLVQRKKKTQHVLFANFGEERQELRN